ncbi:glycosyltransferase [Photobacterium leiognathi]|uniref:glycosyltransferase n=1 Tax=Photobacterium leiognathi TaxID=553611 RepID=UPI002738B599|nr:glycosyltransferase [Photobacterium leiognathi]
MKILMLINSFSGGGAEKVFVNLANSFKDKNINVVYVVGSNTGPNKNKINNEITVHDISENCSNFSILLRSYKMFNILKTEKPDVVFSTLELSNILNIFYVSIYNIFNKKKIKIVTREANTLTCIDSKQKKRFFTVIFDLFLKKFSFISDLIICNSPDTKKDVMEVRNIKESQIKVIPNPVLDKSNFINRKKSNNSNKFNIINVGRLTYQKNQEFLIDVMKLLIDEGIEVTLDIYGEGELLFDLDCKIKELNLESYVFLKGFSDNITEEYHKYDIFCLSSKWEGFGNVFVEALANGLPLLSLDSPGGPKFIITDSIIGSTCNNDIYEYKNKLISLIRNDNDSKISYRIEKAMNYKVDVISDLYIAVISDIVKTNRKL